MLSQTDVLMDPFAVSSITQGHVLLLVGSVCLQMCVSGSLCCCGGPQAGELREYVMQEANVCEVEICADPLEYACVRAQPNYQVSPPPI